MKKLLRHLDHYISRLHNVWRWLPIIWKDRDWDHYFFYEMMKHKLINMADSFETNQIHKGWERDVQRMRLCVKLIEAVQDDKYQMEAYNFHDFTVDNNVEEYLAAHKSTAHKVLIDKKYQWYPNDNRHLVLMNVGIYRHQQAKRILFTILERYSEHWWN